MKCAGKLLSKKYAKDVFEIPLYSAYANKKKTIAVTKYRLVVTI